MLFLWYRTIVQRELESLVPACKAIQDRLYEKASCKAVYILRSFSQKKKFLMLIYHRKNVQRDKQQIINVCYLLKGVGFLNTKQNK